MSNSKHKTGRKPLKLGTVENYHHHWYLLIWLVYLTLFAIAEHVVTDNYWVSYLPLDDKIPFCRYFIIPYCLWHPLLFLMTLYLMFYDAEGLKRYMLYIGLGFGGSILFCLIFPGSAADRIRAARSVHLAGAAHLCRRHQHERAAEHARHRLRGADTRLLRLRAAAQAAPAVGHAAAGPRHQHVDGVRQAAFHP